MANILNLGLSAVATGVDTITATYSPAITLSDRRIVYLRTAGTNTTTTPTFNPNGLGAQTITKNNGDALAVGDLGGDVILMYDLANTNWELLTPKASISYGLNGYVNVDGTMVEIFHDTDLHLNVPDITLDWETASRILSTNASQQIKALSTTTYPSLTELAYVKGVTSAIQTQLNGKPKIELMFGTTTVFSPADSTTTYVTVQTNLLVNATATTRQIQGISGTVYGVWLYVDPQNVLGSTEDVTVNLRNITDATSSLLGTIPFDARGRTVLMDVATPIALDTAKFYSFELVFPAWATNPTQVAFLGKALIR